MLQAAQDSYGILLYDAVIMLIEISAGCILCPDAAAVLNQQVAEADEMFASRGKLLKGQVILASPTVFIQAAFSLKCLSADAGCPGYCVQGVKAEDALRQGVCIGSAVFYVS